MYLVKPNGNYNIIITDIDVAISSTNTEGTLVEAEVFENSSHAKNLLAKGTIIAEKVKDGKTSNKTTKTSENKNIKRENNTFVVDKSENDTPENVFVAKAPEEGVKEEQKVEEVKTEVEVEKKPETKTEVKTETKATKTTKTTATKDDKKEETKEEKAEAEKPATAKKTTTKRTTTTNKAKK